MSERDTMRYVALIAGIAILAGPRRTRPLAGFLYGLALSRAQGASRDRLEATLHDLFDQRKSVIGRVDNLERRLTGEADVRDVLSDRISDVEVTVGGWIDPDRHYGEAEQPRRAAILRVRERGAV